MNGRSATAADDSARLVRILEDCLVEAARGTAPDRRALPVRHPDLPDDIQERLASLAFIGRAVAASGPPSAAHLVRPIAHRLGEFQIVREVGRGGMGVIYEATQRPGKTFVCRHRSAGRQARRSDHRANCTAGSRHDRSAASMRFSAGV